jgi:hypothetical protein
MNAINVISPYKHHGMWVFDDARVGLVQEPFVSGAVTDYCRSQNPTRVPIVPQAQCLSLGPYLGESTTKRLAISKTTLMMIWSHSRILNTAVTGLAVCSDSRSKSHSGAQSHSQFHAIKTTTPRTRSPIDTFRISFPDYKH